MSAEPREPLLWVLALIAVVLATVTFAVAGGGDDVDATFAPDTAEPAPELPTTAPLPTPQARPTEAPVTSAVEVAYAPDAITVTGVVPAEAVVEGLRVAAAELVAGDAIEVDVTVDDAASLDGAVLVLTGVIADDSDRARVVSAFADLGLTVDDQLQLEGTDRTVADVLATNPRLSDFADFVAAAGLTEELAADGAGITLFAPTNRAMRELDEIALGDLSDPESLAAVLRYHFVPGRITAGDLAGVTTLVTVQGESVAVSVADGVTLVGGAPLVEADIDAANGLVQVIDEVLLPTTLRVEVRLNEIVGDDPVQFASGSAQILEDSFPTLDRVAELLIENPGGRVEIQGHTDTDGPAPVNLRLSRQRARAVADYLIAAGVAADRVEAVGYGETRPLVEPEESDADRQQNRRIEFRVR